MAAALSIWLVGGQATSGGTSGLTDMQGFSGYSPDTTANRKPDTPADRKPDTTANREVVHFVIAVVVLLLTAFARQPFVSRYGELLVAVRDFEEQVRFLGHDPADVELVAHVVAAARLCPPRDAFISGRTSPERRSCPVGPRMRGSDRSLTTASPR